MTRRDPTDPEPPAADFAERARAGGRGGNVLAELWAFLRVTKKWWLAPILLVLLLVAVLVMLGSSSVAPFIYTLF